MRRRVGMTVMLAVLVMVSGVATAAPAADGGTARATMAEVGRAGLDGTIQLPAMTAEMQRWANTRERVNAVPHAGSRRSAPVSTAPEMPLLSTVPAEIADDEDRRRQAAPVRLVINAIGVDAAVVPVGIDPRSGEMETVDNVADVGWFSPGVRPGQPGSAVLAAHVDLAGRGPGVFFHLAELGSGDSVVVRHGDGSAHQYRVAEVTTVDKAHLDRDRIFSTSGDPTLTLITCGGGFDRALRRYDSNVVVRAELIGPVR